MQVLVGARIFDGERFVDDHALVIDGARIAGLTPYAERPRGHRERDLGGGLIAPGFIDVQVNGGGGALMNENPSVETVARIAESHRQFGTTGLMPTLVTDAPEAIPAAIAAVRKARQILPGVLGIHLEGPFIDLKRRGAHEPRFIREMAKSDVVALGQAECGAVMITIAPNRVPVHFVQELAAHDILISLGHAEASYAEASAALEAGARSFTHLFNAMSQMSGRDPGMVGAALDAEDSFVSIIADGHHLHPASLRIALAAKRHDRLMLITDAMPPAAGGPESFMLQGRKVVSAGGGLRLEDGTLAGSVLTMDEAVRYCVETIGLGLADALAMATLAPATFLRRDDELGRVAPGYLASLVHLSDDLYVRETWIEGR